MHRGRLAGVLLVAALLAASCSSGSGQPDQAGGCLIRPGTVCSNEHLEGVTMVAADLRGADFSGAALTGADLRNADLTNANFAKAKLAAVNFTGAKLKGADFSGAQLFYTNFTGANLSGVNQTGSYICNVTQPDGAFDSGACRASATGSVLPTTKAPTGPPAIQYFRANPNRCLNDASGTGIEVEWSTRNTTTIAFSVDGIRLDGASIKPKSTTRLPFVCDGKPHVVSMQAFGPVLPVATASFTSSLHDTAPLAPPGS